MMMMTTTGPVSWADLTLEADKLRQMGQQTVAQAIKVGKVLTALKVTCSSQKDFLTKVSDSTGYSKTHAFDLMKLAANEQAVLTAKHTAVREAIASLRPKRVVRRVGQTEVAVGQAPDAVGQAPSAVGQAPEAEAWNAWDEYWLWFEETITNTPMWGCAGDFVNTQLDEARGVNEYNRASTLHSHLFRVFDEMPAEMRDAEQRILDTLPPDIYNPEALLFARLLAKAIRERAAEVKVVGHRALVGWDDPLEGGVCDFEILNWPIVEEWRR